MSTVLTGGATFVCHQQKSITWIIRHIELSQTRVRLWGMNYSFAQIIFLLAFSLSRGTSHTLIMKICTVLLGFVATKWQSCEFFDDT